MTIGVRILDCSSEQLKSAKVRGSQPRHSSGPVFGWVLKGMGALPVYRRQDSGSEMGKNEEMFEAAAGAQRSTHGHGDGLEAWWAHADT